MPVLVKSLAHKIVEIQGKAYRVRPDGKLQLLHEGDIVLRGEAILTTQDGIVTLSDDPPLPVAQQAADPCAAAALGDELDAVIAGVSCGSPKYAPAAGQAGGGGGEGGDGGLASGLRVERVTETVTPGGLQTSGSTGMTAPMASFGGASGGGSGPAAAAGGDAAMDAGLGGASDGTPGVTGSTGGSLTGGADGNVVGGADGGAGDGTTGGVNDGTGSGADGPSGGGPGGTVASIGVDLDSDDSTGVPGTGRQTTYTEGMAPAAVPDPDAVVTASADGALITGAQVVLVDGQPGDLLAVGQLPDGLKAEVDGVRVSISGAASPAIYAQALEAVTFATTSDDPGTADRQVAVTVTDGQQTSPIAWLTVHVVPVNDAPLVAADAVAVAYDSPQVAVDVLANDRDPEGGALQLVGAAVDEPGRGTVELLPNGMLGFTPAPGTSGTVLVHYQVTDPQGAVSEGVLTVQVGPNMPPDGMPFAREIAEDGQYRFTVDDFGFSDSDEGQTLAGIRIDTTPETGALSLHGEPVTPGQFVPADQLAGLVYAPPPDASGDLLGALTFSVRDSSGAYAEQPDQAFISVTPQPDAATITPDSGSVVEDTLLSTGGLLGITDPDAGEARFEPQQGSAGSFGSFDLAEDGQWSYVLHNDDPRVQALGEGQTLIETFTVHSVDGTASGVTVTIRGTNDGAVIDSPSAAGRDAGTGSVTEDRVLQTGGVLEVTDVDTGEAVLVPQAETAGAYGHFTLDAGGEWNYTLDNSLPQVQALGEGQSLTESFTVKSADGTESTVRVTINGTNDAPVITSDGGEASARLDVAENATEVTTVASRDIDAGDMPSYAIVGGADAHLFTIDARTGALSFQLAPDFEAPADADQDNVYAVDVQVSDGQGGVDLQALQVAVTGVNERPVAVCDVGTLTEGTAFSTNVLANDHDPDAGDTLSVTQFSVAGVSGGFAPGSTVLLAGVGSFILAADGHASFAPSPGYSGAVPPITYTASDGALTSEATIELTVTPGEDKPVICVVEPLPSSPPDPAVPPPSLPPAGDFEDTDHGDFTDTGHGEFQDSKHDDFKDSGHGKFHDSKFDDFKDSGHGKFQDPKPDDFKDSGHGKFQDSKRDDFKDTKRDDFKDSGHGKFHDSKFDDFKDSGHGKFQDSKRDDFKDSGHGKFHDSKFDDFKDSGHGKFHDSKFDDFKDSGHGKFQDSKHDDFKDSGHGKFQDSKPDDFKDSGHGKFQDSKHDDFKDTHRQDFADTVRCDFRDSHHGNFQDTLQDGHAQVQVLGGTDHHNAYGTAGTDVFRWQLAEHDQHDRPAHDVVHEFDMAARDAGGDVLDLRELLVGEAAGAGCGPGNLDQYLHFDTTSVAGSTVVHVSTAGGLGSGGGGEDQRITLCGVDIRASLGLGACAGDDQIIQELMQRNKLDVGP